MLRSTDCTALLRRGVAGTMAVAVLLALGGDLPAQRPGVHYEHRGVMPPGAIGSRQLLRGGPVQGFFQPVEIEAPNGASISLAAGGAFTEPRPTSVKVGLLIGQVYRLKVGNIRLHEGHEVFPTLEVIDRIYAPADQARRFPIPVELTEEDLVLALSGKFVTRVIYLEDPRRALPVRQDPSGQHWFEAPPGSDPLAEADVLGRPVAILRLGARVPEGPLPDQQFLFGSPPFAEYPPEPKPALPEAKPQNGAKPGAEALPAPEAKPAEPQPQVKVLPPPPGRRPRQEATAVPISSTRP